MKHAFRHRMIERASVAAILCLVAIFAIPHRSAAAPAKDKNPRAYCTRVGTDDQVRAAPASLAADVRRLFNVDGRFAVRSSVYRCADGAVLVCVIGANLPCGKANTAKELPAATQWCASHRESDFIPMVVTGHDTLYSWRCVGGKAEAGAPLGALDARGFFAQNWKRVD
jgi:hypothetical protein